MQKRRTELSFLRDTRENVSPDQGYRMPCDRKLRKPIFVQRIACRYPAGFM